jgi:hypothetical protein
VLDDVAGLSPDLLHPGDQGMIFMGENLARRLKPLIQSISDKLPFEKACRVIFRSMRSFIP